MSRASKYHSVKGYIIRETDKAVRMEIHEIGGIATTDEDGNNPSEWFPVSQLDSITRVKEPGEMDQVMASDWILKAKELL